MLLDSCAGAMLGAIRNVVKVYDELIWQIKPYGEPYKTLFAEASQSVK